MDGIHLYISNYIYLRVYRQLHTSTHTKKHTYKRKLDIHCKKLTNYIQKIEGIHPYVRVYTGHQSLEKKKRNPKIKNIIINGKKNLKHTNI